MTIPAYAINVFWSDDDTVWVAEVPDLAYLSALGDTPHEAVAEVEIAIEALHDLARSISWHVPPPSAHPVHA